MCGPRENVLIKYWVAGFFSNVSVKKIAFLQFSARLTETPCVVIHAKLQQWTAGKCWNWFLYVKGFDTVILLKIWVPTEEVKIQSLCWCVAFFSCLGEQAAVRIGSGFYGISLVCNKEEIIQFLNVCYHCSNGKNNTLSPLFILSISSYGLILWRWAYEHLQLDFIKSDGLLLSNWWK